MIAFDLMALAAACIVTAVLLALVILISELTR